MEPYEDTASIKAVTQAIKDRKIRKQRRLISIYVRRLIFVLLLLAFSFTVYAIDQSDLFRVKTISVVGNVHIDDQEVISLSEIKLGDRIWLTSKNNVRKRVSTSPWVSQVIVLKKGNQVTIEVTEHRILGYRVTDRISLLLQSGQLIPLKESQLDWIATASIITGFEDDEVEKKLVDAFSAVDDSIMLFISEIHQNPTTYDQQMIRLIMSDGNQIFTDYAGLDLINEYKLIVSQINPENKCIYFDALHRAYSSRPCQGE